MKFLVVPFYFLTMLSLLNLSCIVQSQKIASYEDIKNLPNHPEILLIDVRDYHEVERTGLIPTSIVIPC